MPFALIFIGLVLIVAAVRGTQDTLFGLLKGDLTGQNNYVYWIAAIFVIGALGYIKELKQFSTAFLVLICVGILVSNQGFFANFQSQLASTQTGGTTSATNPSNASTALGIGQGLGLTNQATSTIMGAVTAMGGL